MNTISHDSETPAPRQQVITACAFIHHNFGGTEKLFMPKRAATKKFLPGIFELPGGHIDFGEDPVDGLKREILEELGMNIFVGDSFANFTYTNHIKGSHSVELIYFAVFEDALEKIQLNPEDHSEFVWISQTEIGRVLSKDKGEDDSEIKAIKRGFEILHGGKIVTL